MIGCNIFSFLKLKSILKLILFLKICTKHRREEKLTLKLLIGYKTINMVKLVYLNLFLPKIESVLNTCLANI